jgi:hypothetical protein
MIGMGVILVWIAATPSLALGQDAHAQHGSDPAETPAGTFQAKMTLPAQLQPGVPFMIDIAVQDAHGRQVPEFELFQEKLMHLILVSDDLAYFTHLHPEHRGNGVFQVKAMLPSAGGYTLFCDYKPARAIEQISILKLRMQGAEKPTTAADMNRTEKTVQGIQVRMNVSPKPARADAEVVVRFNLQWPDGSPVAGLEPYLGEKGHLVVIRKSAPLNDKDYIHAHAMQGGEASTIGFTTRFPTAGPYKLWCQINHQGRILTVDFWVNIER